MRPYRFAALRLAWPLAGALALGLFVFDASEAKMVSVPATKPKVLLDVPDDWTVTPTGNNVELRAPGNTSIIVAGVVKRDKAEVIAWHKMATSKMVAFGIKFDPNAAAPPPPAPKSPPKSAESKPDVIASLSLAKPSLSTAPTVPAAAAIPADKASNGLQDAGVAPPTVFSGAPSLALPEHASPVETATEDKEVRSFSLEQLTGKAPMDLSPLKYKAAFLYGATLDGKPVDAQFLNFGLAQDAAFLMQQESASDDDRAVGIAKSVRRAP